MKTINTAATIISLFNTLSHMERQKLSLDLFRSTIDNNIGAAPVAKVTLRKKPIDMTSRCESWEARVTAYAQSRRGHHWTRQQCAIALNAPERVSHVSVTLHLLKKKGVISHTGINRYTLGV